jgi:hypothetical protein
MAEGNVRFRPQHSTAELYQCVVVDGSENDTGAECCETSSIKVISKEVSWVVENADNFVETRIFTAANT